MPFDVSELSFEAVRTCKDRCAQQLKNRLTFGSCRSFRFKESLRSIDERLIRRLFPKIMIVKQFLERRKGGVDVREPHQNHFFNHYLGMLLPPDRLQEILFKRKLSAIDGNRRNQFAEGYQCR